MASTLPQGTIKLPFWANVGEALALPFRYPGAVLKLSWLWALVLAGATGLLHALLDEGQIAAIQKGETLGPAGLNLTSLLMGLIVGASVAVGWHRVLLRGEPPPPTSYLRLDNTVWRYIAVASLMLLITLPFLLAFHVFTAKFPPSLRTADPAQVELDGPTVLLPPVLLISLAFALFVTTRLSLALPARALDMDGFTLSDSWRLTRGNFWRLFAGGLICYLPAMALGGLFAGLAGPDTGTGGFLLGNMLISVSGLVTSVFPLSYLSLAYKHFTSGGPRSSDPRA